METNKPMYWWPIEKAIERLEANEYYFVKIGNYRLGLWKYCGLDDQDFLLCNFVLLPFPFEQPASPLENKTAEEILEEELDNGVLHLKIGGLLLRGDAYRAVYSAMERFAASTNTVEITDEEIEKEAVFRFTDGHGQDDAYSTGVFIHACKWYRSELRRKGGKGE